jgi:hypothetical protein
MARGDLTDAEWRIVEPLLPAERGRKSRPSHDNRQFMNGMLHVLRAWEKQADTVKPAGIVKLQGEVIAVYTFGPPPAAEMWPTWRRLSAIRWCAGMCSTMTARSWIFACVGDQPVR